MRLEKNVCKSIPPFLSWNLSKYESFKTKPLTLSPYRFCKRKRSHGKPDRSPTSTRKTSGFGTCLNNITIEQMLKNEGLT